MWEDHPAWQPLRRVIERLLVTYDWGEAFTALQLVLKPAFDRLLVVHLATWADANGDGLLVRMLGSLDEDCVWHREWSAELLRELFRHDPANVEVARRWVERWHPSVAEAVAALAPLLSSPDARPSVPPLGDILAELARAPRLPMPVGGAR